MEIPARTPVMLLHAGRADVARCRERLLISAIHRAEVIAALAAVDVVVIFDEDTPADIVRALQPDVLVKGADWAHDAVVGRDVVEARGGVVVRVPIEEGHSMTGIVEKLKRKAGSPDQPDATAPVAGAKPKASVLAASLPSLGTLGAWVLILVGLVLPWQSFFWIDSVPALTKVGYAGLTVLSAWRPGDGLLVAAALAILGGPIAGLTGAIPNRGAESIILAFLVGWVVRATWRREPMLGRADHLGVVTAIFGVLVISSLVVTLLVEQTLWGPPGQYFNFMVPEFARHYLDALRISLGNLYATALLLEGGLLLLAVIVLSRREPGLPDRVTRMLVLGAVAAAVLSCVRLAMGLLRSVEPMKLLWSTYTGLRLTFYVSDLNAAGSHAAMVMLMVAGLALSRRRLAWLWSLAWLPLVPALWLTGSRTAFAAVLLVPVLGVFHQRWRRAFVVGAPVVVAGVVAMLMLWPTTLPLTRWTLAESGSSRVSFLKMSWQMWQEAPVFGLGIGEYPSASARFMPPDLRVVFFTENAHNNFAQIGVELGLVGLVFFLWILAAAWSRMRPGMRRAGSDTVVLGIALGLGAFLLTCLAGHPLLVGPVSFAFWLTIGAGVAGADALRVTADRPAAEPLGDVGGAAARTAALARAAIVCLLAVVLPLRAVATVRALDLSTVRYGFAVRETDPQTGESFRLVGPSASLFVSQNVRVVRLSVSAETHAGAVELEFRLDGKLANRVLVPDSTWRNISLLMPSTAPSSRFRRLDIEVYPAGTPSKPDGNPTGRPGSTVRVRNVSYFPPPG